MWCDVMLSFGAFSPGVAPAVGLVLCVGRARLLDPMVSPLSPSRRLLRNGPKARLQESLRNPAQSNPKATDDDPFALHFLLI